VDWLGNIRVVLKDSDRLRFTRQELIGKVMEELTSDILETTAVSTPQELTAWRPVSLIPPYFQDKIRLKNKLRILCDPIGTSL
jgi:hypothetical protein